jgi:hypothetical protein
MPSQTNVPMETIELQWGAAFSTQSVPRCFKLGKLEAAISKSVERRLRGWCEMPASLAVEAMSQLWDIHQVVRTLAEDILKIHYQEPTCEDIKDFMCATVTVIFSVCKLVMLL